MLYFTTTTPNNRNFEPVGRGTRPGLLILLNKIEKGQESTDTQKLTQLKPPLPLKLLSQKMMWVQYPA